MLDSTVVVLELQLISDILAPHGLSTCVMRTGTVQREASCASVVLVNLITGVFLDAHKSLPLLLIHFLRVPTGHQHAFQCEGTLCVYPSFLLPLAPKCSPNIMDVSKVDSTSLGM